MTDVASSVKNAPLASQDLGMGDALQNEVAQQVAARRKKAMMAGGSNLNLIGQASSDLFQSTNTGLAV